MVPKVFDLIIVGAGPAGSAAALAALQANPACRVALVDASDFPRDKTCGDGIAPQALNELATLGVPDAAAGFAPVRRLRLRSPLGREVVAEPKEPAYCIPREVFDDRLVKAAVARGAVLFKRRIRTLTMVDDGVELAPDSSSVAWSSEPTVPTPPCVACSGSPSTPLGTARWPCAAMPPPRRSASEANRSSS